MYRKQQTILSVMYKRCVYQKQQTILLVMYKRYDAYFNFKSKRQDSCIVRDMTHTHTHTNTHTHTCE